MGSLGNKQIRYTQTKSTNSRYEATGRTIFTRSGYDYISEPEMRTVYDSVSETVTRSVEFNFLECVNCRYKIIYSAAEKVAYIDYTPNPRFNIGDICKTCFNITTYTPYVAPEDEKWVTAQKEYSFKGIHGVESQFGTWKFLGEWKGSQYDIKKECTLNKHLATAKVRFRKKAIFYVYMFIGLGGLGIMVGIGILAFNFIKALFGW